MYIYIYVWKGKCQRIYPKFTWFEVPPSEAPLDPEHLLL